MIIIFIFITCCRYFTDVDTTGKDIANGQRRFLDRVHVTQIRVQEKEEVGLWILLIELNSQCLAELVEFGLKRYARKREQSYLCSLTVEFANHNIFSELQMRSSCDVWLCCI